MADSKITALTALTAADPANDMMPIVDVSDTSMAASGTTKRISINNILACSPSATLASATITGDLTVRTNQLVVNATGIGVGTTPSAWSGIGPAIQVEQASLLSESSNQLYLTANGYFAGGQWNYINNASADQYYQIAGSHVWRSGTGGAGGTAIGWSTLMTLNSTGLGIGAGPSYRLHVQGTASLQLVLQSNDTNANAKEGTVNIRHYTNAEEPVSAVGGFTTSSANEVYLGGGFSAGNAATLLGFYTAANNTTTIGTERVRVKGTGQVRFVPLAADPSGAEAGDVYYNSVSNRLKYYNGTAWTLI